MRKNIRYIFLIAILSLHCILTGCSGSNGIVKSENENNKNIKIGISVYDDYDTFISDMIREFNEWGRTKQKERNITLDIVSANRSQLTQNDQVEKFIAKDYDAICVNLVDRTDASLIIDKAKKADIPVIFFNREPVEDDIKRWNKLYYVGADAEQSAKLQAEIVKDVLSNPNRFEKVDVNMDNIIQYVMLEGEAGHQDALVRTQISIDEIKNAGFQLEKLGDEIANWNKIQATTKMKGLLEKYPWEIEMVIANDDDMALGAIEAFLGAGYSTDNLPLIVGVNGTKNALEMIQSKKMEGTAYNNAIGQADIILDMAYELSCGRDLSDMLSSSNEKYVYLDYEKITFDNVQKYIRIKEK